MTFFPITSMWIVVWCKIVYVSGHWYFDSLYWKDSLSELLANDNIHVWFWKLYRSKIYKICKNFAKNHVLISWETLIGRHDKWRDSPIYISLSLSFFLCPFLSLCGYIYAQIYILLSVSRDIINGILFSCTKYAVWWIQLQTWSNIWRRLRENNWCMINGMWVEKTGSKNLWCVPYLEKNVLISGMMAFVVWWPKTTKY